MNKLAKIAFSAIVLIWLLFEYGNAQTQPTGVQVRADPQRVVIENPFLSLEISLEENRVQTKTVTNRRTGQVTRLSGEDFLLVLGSGRTLSSNEFRLEKRSTEPTATDGKRLIIHLAAGDLRVRLVNEINPQQWWLTRWLEIEGGSGQLDRFSLCRWRCEGARGKSGPGTSVGGLGYPQGNGQPVYVEDLFLAIDHPGAENYVRENQIDCTLPAYDSLGGEGAVHTRKLVLGAGEAGNAWPALLGYIDARREFRRRMIFLANDWYWRDKSKPVEAIEALAEIKQQFNIPVDSFTLDDGWDFDWDEATGLWGRLNRKRFPGGWESLQAAGRPADINISLWVGPIGGYGQREKRVEFAREVGFEINGDKLCLSGPRYRDHVVDSFSQWARRGMDYIKVDGFWPDCARKDHGHPVGPAGAIAHMDALIDVFAAWRRASPELPIAYTSGSNPSPFWLEHVEYVWRGGADDSHAGAGDPFDRHNTYIDSCLQPHRTTEMPMSAFVVFDIVAHRIAASSDQVFERNAWWLAARTSLHHDWYLQAGDLTPVRWKALAQVADWAKGHERLFRNSRMVAGDPRRGEIYGFCSFDGDSGTLALRNPSDKSKTLDATLDALLAMPQAARKRSFKLERVYGATGTLEGIHPATASVRIQLPPLEIAIVEVEAAGRSRE